ncbi:hypothetical protein FNV43_RR14759 [Rhamnella rubrinervis]|uniref:Glycosyltransferase n=1 Tax=Rhamnella rubrinervis TaxID=2594499 RepID=A0A8K0H3E5_9ROSA|nr:hypothetical protein FNV43_RR14759 [Rhamnella rubrinervis]
MNKAQLVFVPGPGMGHLATTVEFAKLIVNLDDRLSITVLVMNLPFDHKVGAYIDSLSASTSIPETIKFINLPQGNVEKGVRPMNFLISFMENHKPHVRDAVHKLTHSDSAGSLSPRLAGFFIDMFCTTMIDVANEFGVPAYLFYTSNAGCLGLMLHFQGLRDKHELDTTELKNDRDAELAVPSFSNHVPARVFPDVILDENRVDDIFNFVRRFRETKGILVNTFAELESHAVSSFSGRDRTPIVYPVGPILNLDGDVSNGGSGGSDGNADIIKWLDDQPDSSVVFLCFGSMGYFGESQVQEIARALENSGYRFVWSLRKPPPKDKIAMPTEYEDFKEVLPEEFLDRTAEKGKVIGWAPQVAILSHRATGGFVSHCGWNSILESIWHGVPIATWPFQAEQQLNAFGMVRELGLAVEIKLDFKRDLTGGNNEMKVSAEEIEDGLRKVMEHDSDVRKRTKEMSEKSREALMKGGSSYFSLHRTINDLIA